MGIWNRVTTGLGSVKPRDEGNHPDTSAHGCCGGDRKKEVAHEPHTRTDAGARPNAEPAEKKKSGSCCGPK